MARVATELGVPASTLRGWIRQARLERQLQALQRQLDLLQPVAALEGEAVQIRTLHHLACTGGTVISKCLAAMPGVALLSEVNPLHRPSGEVRFAPANPLLLLEQGYRTLTLEEIRSHFLTEIAQILRLCRADGAALVIRDHSHSDFCRGEVPMPLSPVRDFLAGAGYRLRSVVTVRHPLDSYLGLLAQGWQNQFSPATLEEYCCRSLAFLDRYRGLPLRRYEDFCADPPAFLQELCCLLQLDYSPRFMERFGAMALSGDSGRSSTAAITKRSRRLVPAAVQA